MKTRRKLKQLLHTTSVKVEKTKCQGRYLSCAQDIKAGDVVFESEPYAIAVSDQYKRQICSGCFRHLTTTNTNQKVVTIPCKKCNEVFYCSTTCLEQNDIAATRHFSEECEVLKQLHGNKYDGCDMSIFRLMLKVLCRRYHVLRARKQQLDTTGGETCENYSDFEHVADLVSHHTSGKEESQMTKEELGNLKLARTVLLNMSTIPQGKKKKKNRSNTQEPNALG